MFSAQRLPRVPIVCFGALLFGLLSITPVTTADQYEERVAAANANIEKARRDLRRLQARQQELIRNLDNNHKKHVAETILAMYQTARKFNILEEAVNEGEITEEEAIAEFEEFTGIRAGKTSLVNSFTHAMQEVKKGRLGHLDDLDKKISDALLRFQWAHFQLRSVARLRRIESRGTTDDPVVHTWAEDGPLAISASQEHIDMQVGEIKEVTLTFAGSKPPYKLRFASLSGENSRELALASREPQVVPFSFATPGIRTVQVFVEDESFPRQRAGLTLTFRVVEAENEPDPPEEPPEPPKPPPSEKAPPTPGKPPAKPPAKPTPAKPPTNPPPPTQPTTPPQGNTTMLNGRFRARLWGIGFATPSRVTKDNEYTPLVLSIDAGGAISGEVNYDVPENLLDKGWDNHRVAQSQNIRFTLDGTTDPKTGRSTIRVVRGRREMDTKQRDGRRYQYIVEFESTLHGWRIPSPSDEDLLVNSNLDAIRRNTPAQEQRVIPDVGTDSEGKPVFLQRGFFNFIRVDPQVDPGSLQVNSNVEYWQSDDGGGSREFPAKKTPVHAWFIEILGPADDDDSSDRELLMVAIWPRSPVRVTGDTVRLTAHGVWSDRPFDAVNVTNEATWRWTRGLEPVIGAGGTAQKGHYRLSQSAYDEQGRPRWQSVRAGVRKGLDWTADTVKVVPTAPQIHVDEQPESPE